MKLFHPKPAAWIATVLLAFVAIAHVRAQVAGEAGLADAPRAKSDMYAPSDFVVVDVERSMRVFSAQGEPVPLVVRVNTHATSLMVEQLNEAFDLAREAFLSALEEAYGARQIEIRRINSAKFRSFQNEFQSANPLFPVNLVLAQSWAKGYDGISTRDRLASAMTSVTREYYLADFAEDTVLFIASTPEDAVVRSWSDAAQTVRLADHGEILGIEEAGFLVRRSLDALDRSVGGFVTGLLRPTVAVDEHLTGLLMRERLGDRVVMKKFNEGDFIVRAGEPLDRWTSLAIETVERMGLDTPEVISAVEKVVVEVNEPPVPVSVEVPEEIVAPLSPPPVEAQSTTARSFWQLLDKPFVAGGLAGGLVGCLGLAVWMLFLRKGPGSTSLVVQSQGQPSDLREAIVPHLARELKNRLVSVLFAQRHALLENEEAASERVREMEARLARLQPAIAEKIRSYEQRIENLEKEIEEKDQETRDLLRAKLVLARKELDAEISRNRIDWN